MMDFKNRQTAKQLQRVQDRTRKLQMHKLHREKLLAGAGTLEVESPLFDQNNMVDGIWFKHDQKGTAQTVWLPAYDFPSEYPGDIDEVTFERKRRGDPQSAYQRLGPTIAVEAIAGQFPYPVQMSADYMLDEGEFDFRFYVHTWGGSDAWSEPAQATLDWTAPGQLDAPLADVEFAFDRETQLVDDAYLASQGGKLTVKIKAYANRAPGDAIWWAWLTELPAGPSLPPGLVHVQPLADNREVDISAQVINATGEGEGHCYFFYLLVDKAGNTSRLSLAFPVKVALGPLPGPILIPSVPLAEPQLEYADIAEGIDVVIPPVGDFRFGDDIVVTWGGVEVTQAIPSGADFPMAIRMPHHALAAGYPVSGSGPVDLQVSYAVRRGKNAWGSPTLTIKVDFSTAGPPNPEWPDPVNPDLPPPVLRPFSGADNTLEGPANFERDAHLLFTLHAQPREGEIIQAFWQGSAAGPAHIVDANAGEGDAISLQIPWDAIQAVGDDLQLPAAYSVRSGPDSANELWCAPVPVRVLVVPIRLAPPRLPQTETTSNPNRVVNCTVAQADHGRVWVKVPYHRDYVRDGVEVTVHWAGYTRGADGLPGEVVPSTQQTQVFTWAVDNDIAYVEPARDRLFGLHPADSGSGFSRCWYSVIVKGITLSSDVQQNRLTMGTPAGLCPIAVPL